MVKYPFWVHKLLHYTIQHEGVAVAAILSFGKCLYLRGRLQLTTARRLSACMSSRALATTTTSIVIYMHLFDRFPKTSFQLTESRIVEWQKVNNSQVL